MKASLREMNQLRRMYQNYEGCVGLGFPRSNLIYNE